MKHASIIPLIGGITLAQHEVSGTLPEYLMTYTGFQENESHLLNYYKDRYGVDLPYHFIDQGQRPQYKVDIVNTVCPCAGLSMLSHGFGEHNQNNQWMIKTAEYVLTELQPQVFWGENAPNFIGKIGEPIREKIYKIGRDNGYTMSIYKTKSLLHETPQIRERCFYFFWKGDKVPIFKYYNRPWIKIEDLMRSCTGNTMNEPINPKLPSSDPYYRFILEEIFGGIDHKTMINQKMKELNIRSMDVFSLIEHLDYDYNKVGSWMAKNGFENEVEKCKYKQGKLDANMNIMRRGTTLPNDYIGAFVGHYPGSLTHPDEDRYVTYREALTIMGFPQDFELLNPKKSANHICQNVPVKTAIDMATEVVATLKGEREMIAANKLYQYNMTKKYDIIDYDKKTVLEFV